MAEIWFVFKVFTLSCFFVVCLQYKLDDGNTLENKILSNLRQSQVSGWMKSVGEGAVRMTASTVNNVMDPQQLKERIKEDQMKKVIAEEQKIREQDEAWFERVQEQVDGL